MQEITINKTNSQPNPFKFISNENLIPPNEESKGLHQYVEEIDLDLERNDTKPVSLPAFIKPPSFNPCETQQVFAPIMPFQNRDSKKEIDNIKEQGKVAASRRDFRIKKKSMRKIGSLDTVQKTNFTPKQFLQNPYSPFQKNQNNDENKETKSPPSKFKEAKSRQFLGIQHETSMMSSNALSQHSFMIPTQQQDESFDQKDDLIYEICSIKNVGGNLLKIQPFLRMNSI